MRIRYLFLNYFLIREIRKNLIKIVLANGKNVSVFSTMTAGDLYYKMRDVYRDGLKIVTSGEEMKSNYRDLFELNQELKAYLNN